MKALPILALIGPTGVGKTELSLRLVAQLDGEIISADSRQVYRSLTIGTAKPTVAERCAAPHHFVDELDLTDAFSAGRFAEAANSRIGEILDRGRTPIVVGGSTLYIEALLHGLDDVPETTAETRQHLMARLHTEGSVALFEELLRVDPASGATMDPTKSQRIVRALEVFHDTGRPLSHYYGKRSTPPYPFRPIVLTRPRAELYDRINRRVDRMLDDGLIEENRALLEAGISPDLNPLRTIGYREPLAYLHGDYGYATMVRLLKQNTRRYAKRQITWFKRRSAYHWIDISGKTPERLIAEISNLQ